jgi:hypothetical protein
MEVKLLFPITSAIPQLARQRPLKNVVINAPSPAVDNFNPLIVAKSRHFRQSGRFGRAAGGQVLVTPIKLIAETAA